MNTDKIIAEIEGIDVPTSGQYSVAYYTGCRDMKNHIIEITRKHEQPVSPAPIMKTAADLSTHQFDTTGYVTLNDGIKRDPETGYYQKTEPVSGGTDELKIRRMIYDEVAKVRDGKGYIYGDAEIMDNIMDKIRPYLQTNTQGVGQAIEEIKPCPYVNGFGSDNSNVSFVFKKYEPYSDFILMENGKPSRCFRFSPKALHTHAIAGGMTRNQVEDIVMEHLPSFSIAINNPNDVGNYQYAKAIAGGIIAALESNNIISIKSED